MDTNHIPLWDHSQSAVIEDYALGRISFLPGLLPSEAVGLPMSLIVKVLELKFGKKSLRNFLDPDHSVASPVAGKKSPKWLKRVNIVGINVRTISNFWNVVKYALTLPDSQSAIHLLPVWEPGVVSSLYGIASWNINPEFFSRELYEAYPHLDTVERQLKAVINCLHAMGKTVGLDVIPHTDRYSEIVLANPHYFEWLQRKGLKIVNHRNDLHEEVQDAILLFLKKNGSNGVPIPADRKAFFSENFGETRRIHALFGQLRDYGQRSERRAALMDFLFRKGYEPVPATMAPPYRGLLVDKNPTAETVDKAGRRWRDYVIEKPTPFSRVFGPLTRYKFFECLDDNRNWQLDFNQPRKAVWAYVQQSYARICDEYGFDFMRGDMSHVQMRADGPPAKPDPFYDPLAAVKQAVQKTKPWFGYFAESFLAPAGVMQYGDEIDHLEAADADTALGDLQSMVMGSGEFLQNFRWYLDVAASRRVTPSFTLMTADKDDPRFDKFYVNGNEARLFIALFMPDMPSYMGLGFECRDTHLTPAPNEHYTKLFVFKMEAGDKATKGNFIWGKNNALFHNLLHIRLFAEKLLPQICNDRVRWLLPPDATGHQKVIAWTLEKRPRWVFVVNLDGAHRAFNLRIPALPGKSPKKLTLAFSTLANEEEKTLIFNGKNYFLNNLTAGEGRVYSVE